MTARPQGTKSGLEMRLEGLTHEEKMGGVCVRSQWVG